MTYYNICESLAKAIQYADEVKAGKRVLRLNDSQRRAVEILVNVIQGRSRAPLAGIQGPPGTGKTSVVEVFTRNHVADLLGDIDREIIVYVAPTNHLVVQAFERVVAALLVRGYTIRDIVSLTRIYGSRIGAANCGKILGCVLKGESPPTESTLRDIVYRPVDPGTVKLVFTTEYQRVSGRFTSKPDRIHLIVDEASKSPFYRAFISIADYIMRFKDYPASLTVLGDPEQAITVPEAFRAQRVSLLMDKVMKLLRCYGIEDSNFVMLDVTYRLPGPSEEPISHGFYQDRLRSYEHAKWRLKELSEAFTDLASTVKTRLQTHVVWDTELESIFNAIYEAVTTYRPLVVIETSEFRGSRYITTYDRRRVKLASRAALVLQAFAAEARRKGYVSFSTMVIAPYSDIAVNIPFVFRRFAPYFEPPFSTTVQAVIGGEADAIVSVLGKEYTAYNEYEPLVNENYYQTMYFREPQVLNVQLSRHYKLEIVVGSINRLAVVKHSKYGKLAKTARRIQELIENGKAVQIVLR